MRQRVSRSSHALNEPDPGSQRQPAFLDESDEDLGLALVQRLDQRVRDPGGESPAALEVPAHALLASRDL